MRRKIVLLDEDLVAFAIERCDADEALGRRLVAAAPNIRTGRLGVDYVVKVKRLRAALENARDE